MGIQNKDNFTDRKDKCEKNNKSQSINIGSLRDVKKKLDWYCLISYEIMSSFLDNSTKIVAYRRKEKKLANDPMCKRENRHTPEDEKKYDKILTERAELDTEAYYLECVNKSLETNNKKLQGEINKLHIFLDAAIKILGSGSDNIKREIGSFLLAPDDLTGLKEMIRPNKENVFKVINIQRLANNLAFLSQNTINNQEKTTDNLEKTNYAPR